MIDNSSRLVHDFLLIRPSHTEQPVILSVYWNYPNGTLDISLGEQDTPTKSHYTLSGQRFKTFYCATFFNFGLIIEKMRSFQLHGKYQLLWATPPSVMS